MDTEPNIPLLRKTVEWAEAEAARDWRESEWNQGMWAVQPDRLSRWAMLRDRMGRFVKGGFRRQEQKSAECGTCFCIAGKISYDAGGEPIFDFLGQASQVKLNGETQYISEVARKELGIDRRQAAQLFDGNNTIKDVRRIAEKIAGERL